MRGLAASWGPAKFGGIATIWRGLCPPRPSVEPPLAEHRFQSNYFDHLFRGIVARQTWRTYFSKSLANGSVHLFSPPLTRVANDCIFLEIARIHPSASLRPLVLKIAIFYLLLWRGWLGSRVFSVLDSGAEGPGFKSQPRRCWVTVLSKLFTPIVPLFTKQRN